MGGKEKRRRYEPCTYSSLKKNLRLKKRAAKLGKTREGRSQDAERALAAAGVLSGGADPFGGIGLDKRRARHGAWRISEKALFLPAILGGALGGILGMRTFRHKTRHWYFRFGFPLLLLAQVALAGWLIWKFH